MLVDHPAIMLQGGHGDRQPSAHTHAVYTRWGGARFVAPSVLRAGPDLCLPTGGGGGRGIPLGLPQDQAAHPPTQADPPTHPPSPPPYPPMGGGVCAVTISW